MILSLLAVKTTAVVVSLNASDLGNKSPTNAFEFLSVTEGTLCQELIFLWGFESETKLFHVAGISYRVIAMTYNNGVNVLGSLKISRRNPCSPFF